MIGNAARILPYKLALTLGALALPVLLAGCPSQPGGGSGGGGGSGDVFAEAKADAEPGEAPYLDASRPILQAIAARDYAALYGMLSSHAKAQTQPGQFVPSEDEKASATTPLKDLTQAQFNEWMGKMEKALGQPKAVMHLYVDTIDPEVLSGKGDPLEVMFAIGGMRKEIPTDIRKAAIRAQITVAPSEAAVQAIAKELEVTPDEVRAGTSAKVKEFMEEEGGPYLNLKFVLVEEQGLKVGHFEFMPPSILD